MKYGTYLGGLLVGFVALIIADLSGWNQQIVLLWVLIAWLGGVLDE